MTAQPTISFVCYHYLSRDDEFKRLYGHSLLQFENHLSLLMSKYSIISFNDFKNHIDGKKKLTGDRLILTFDDGLKEHSSIIAPILEKNGIKGIFSVGGATLDNRPLNPQVIHCGMALFGIRKFYELFLSYSKKSNITDSDFQIDDKLKINIWDFYTEIKRKLKYSISSVDLRKILLAIWDEEILKAVPDAFSKIYMNTEDIKTLHQNGHTISLHSNTHVLINDANFTENLMHEEIVIPKNKIEALIGESISCFSYPFAHAEDVMYEKENLEKMHSIGINYIFTIFRKDSILDKDFLGRYSSQMSDTVENLANKIWNYEISNTN